jgi:squalene-associated FAD-dependent desaturase
MSAPRIVVVGGGLAGLAAALRCADAGASVTLLERRPRLGGATWSFARRGLWFDNGQHVFLRCCTAYQAFLARIGAEGGVHLQDRLAVPVVAPGGRRAWLRRHPLPAPLHLAPSLAGYGHLSPGRRLRAAAGALALRGVDPDDPNADAVAFADWLAAHGQDGATIEAVWDLIGRPTLNLTAAEASLAQAAMVFRTGLLGDPAAADIGWARVPLSALHGGPAARALAGAGAEIRLGAPVEVVERGPDGGPAVRLDRGEVITADGVVVATPPPAAAGLLPPGTLPGPVERLGTSPIVNVTLVYDRRVTDLPFAAGIGTPVQWVFDRSEAAGLRRGQCLGVSLSAADAYVGRRPADLVATFTAALAELFPAAGRARIEDAVVTREPAATFRCRPGTRALRPGARTGLPGVTLAGAWTATGWPATMEGAVRSGLAAADALLHETPAAAFNSATPAMAGRASASGNR